MQSRVHPKDKRYVKNWPGYDRALVRRGDLTSWLSVDALAAWTPQQSDRPGGLLLLLDGA